MRQDAEELVALRWRPGKYDKVRRGAGNVLQYSVVQKETKTCGKTPAKNVVEAAEA